jgi:hypothetical protein
MPRIRESVERGDELIICEWAFEREDPQHKGYSLTEVDFYGYANGDRLGVEKQHRLSLRKNLTTNEWELYRHYGIAGRKKGRDEVIFSSKNFREALQRANEEARRYVHGWQDDVACEHQPEMWAEDCPKRFV